MRRFIHPMRVRRLIAVVATMSAAYVLSAGDAIAQRSVWPLRTVRLTVAYPPGGVSNAIARALAERVSQQVGFPIVVDNRAGAGGVVAMQELARATPDGHTLVFSAVSPLTLAPRQGPVGFDPAKDIAPVMSVMTTPVLVVGTPAFAGDTFADLIVLARARPGGVRWATSGSATIGHMVLEQVGAASGADITHVPYKGGGPQLVDALSGQFEVLSTNVAEQQLDYVRRGRLKALAVGSPARLAVLPDVPTLGELGFPDANLASVFGIFAPGRTPHSVLLRVNEAFNRALKHPEIRRQLEAANNLPMGGTPADFARTIK